MTMKRNHYINSILTTIEWSLKFHNMAEHKIVELLQEIENVIREIDRSPSIEDAYYTLNHFFQTLRYEKSLYKRLELQEERVNLEDFRGFLHTNIAFFNEYFPPSEEENGSSSEEENGSSPPKNFYLEMVDSLTNSLELERNHSISFIKAVKSLIDGLDHGSPLGKSLLGIEKFIRDALPLENDAQNASVIVQNLILKHRPFG
jgi:hypothetical protein